MNKYDELKPSHENRREEILRSATASIEQIDPEYVMPARVRQVAALMIGFHSTLPDSPLRQDFLVEIFQRINDLPDEGQRAKATRFVADHAPKGSELRDSAFRKFAEFPTRPKLSATLYSLWAKLPHPF